MSASSASLEFPGPLAAVARPQLPAVRREAQALRDQAFRGMALIVASTLFFSGSDVLTKALSSALPPIEIAWFRFVVFSCLVLPLAVAQGGVGAFRTNRPGLQLLRGAGAVGSALFFTAGLAYLPVAEATATSFISPIFITALSIPLLGEVVGWRRWTAAAVGLLGVLMVVRPGTGAFQLATVFPLLAALAWAGAAIVTRKMSGADRPTTTLLYSSLIGAMVLTALVPFEWVTPGSREVALGILVGVLSSIGHWLVVLAYRHGKASTLAPFSYGQIIWSATLAFLLFGAVPDAWTLAGAGVIAASGLYTARRERVRARNGRTT